MKKYLFTIFITFFVLFAFSCKTEISSGTNSNTPENNEASSDTPTADSFFWGKWICMADGKEIDIFEKTVIYDGVNKSVSSSSKTQLTIANFGTFEKQSDSVILKDSIPYFRNGGTNLSYSLKLVGFNNPTARAASGSSLGGYKVEGRSETYTTFTSSTTSENDGTINLTAPVSGDTQTISLENGNNTIVVPGITVSNHDDYLGTIPIVSEGDYILKVFGSIDDSEKLDGYLYANNFKTYPMTLTITNVSEVNSAYSLCKISSAHTNLKFTSVSGENLTEGIAISTLKPGATKTIKLNVSYGELTDGYINTGLNVEITNGKTRAVWVDFVPLRFYRGQLPITVKAKSTESNENASLNGFIIYPDGNNQFFQVAENSSETIYVPTFVTGQNYLLSFSGATVDGELSNSTEMFYTVKTGSTNAKDIISDGSEAFLAFGYGEPNEKEGDAFNADEEFQAYIGDGEIDYFKIPTSLENIVSPSGTQFYTVKFSTSFGNTPATLTKSKGDFVYQSELPVLSENGYTFDGWYLNGSLIDSLKITKSVILVAKWTLVAYPIEYNLNGGVNDEENPSDYTIQDRLVFKEPVRSGYTFDGWYTNNDFSGEAVTGINKGSKGKVTLYAKWDIVNYPIEYNLNGGTNNSENPASYTVEDIITLKTPVRVGYTFDGWYLSSDFSGTAVTGINKGATGSVVLYAKWSVVKYSIEYNLDGGTNNIENPSDYTIQDRVVFKEPVRSGYTFDGWYTNSDFSGEAITGINKGSIGKVILYAKWIANTNTDYFIKHWQQNIINDDYTVFESENKIGTTDTKTSATQKSYTGFTAKSFEQVNIDGSGNSVVNIYYDRNIIKISIDLDGGSSTTQLSGGILSGKFGAAVNFVDPEKEGNRFIGWNTVDGKLPQKFESDADFKALWSKIKLSISIEPLSDINIITDTSGEIVKFTADAGYDSYSWTVDNIKRSETSNIFNLNTKGFVKGTYEIVLIAKKGNQYRSATIMVQVE